MGGGYILKRKNVLIIFYAMGLEIEKTEQVSQYKHQKALY